MTIDLKSGGDYRHFKVNVSTGHEIADTGFETIRIKVDMNGDGTWDIDQNGFGGQTVDYWYPEPPAGGSTAYTARIEVGLIGPQGQGTLRETTVPITVLPTPRVYATQEQDAFIQLRNRDCTTKIPILLLEGFDPQNASFPEMYHRTAWNLIATDLDPEVYEVFILNFHDGGRDVRLNAEVASKAIEKIRELCPNQRLAVVGLSMGGVVARYALAKAEELGADHGVGLFVSYDSPQRGAHVSPDLQGWIEGESELSPVIASLKGLLQSTAAKQMMLSNEYDQSGTFRIALAADILVRVLMSALRDTRMEASGASASESMVLGRKLARLIRRERLRTNLFDRFTTLPRIGNLAEASLGLSWQAIATSTM